MEKFDPKEYRDDLAESLTSKRNLGKDGKELAKEQLNIEKETIEYKRAKIEHKADILTEKSGKESVESSKLEWGPELGQMSWNNAQTKIDNLNKKLGKGEKPWRLPTKDELVAEFSKTDSTPAGFQSGCYWSGTTHPGYSDGAYIVLMYNGNVDDGNKGFPNVRVRCVR